MANIPVHQGTTITSVAMLQFAVIIQQSLHHQELQAEEVILPKGNFPNGLALTEAFAVILAKQNSVDIWAYDSDSCSIGSCRADWKPPLCRYLDRSERRDTL